MPDELKQAETVVVKGVLDFVKANGSDALGLGAQLAGAAIVQALWKRGLVSLADLSPAPSLAEIALREEQVAALSAQAALLAEAAKVNAEQTEALKQKAWSAAAAVGQKLGEIGLKAAIGALASQVK